MAQGGLIAALCANAHSRCGNRSAQVVCEEQHFEFHVVDLCALFVYMLLHRAWGHEACWALFLTSSVHCAYLCACFAPCQDCVTRKGHCRGH